MFWIIACSVLGIGISVGIVLREKGKYSVVALVFALTLFGGIVGTILGGVSTGIAHYILDDNKYEYVEKKTDEIAVSEAGNVLYFDIDSTEGEPFICFMNDKNEVKSVKLEDHTIEFVDSDFCIVRRTRRIAGWYRIFVFEENNTVLRISEDAWKNASQ